MIASAQLCALTGLSDQRHRQLARDGYFPPPINGQYQLNATVKGIFAYYRNSAKNRVGEAEKKLEIERETKQFKLGVLRGQYLVKSEAEAAWSEACIKIRNRILALEKLAPSFVGLPIMELAEGLRRASHDILIDLSAPACGEQPKRGRGRPRKVLPGTASTPDS